MSDSDGSERSCLDLFSGREGFSSAFQKAGDWRVVTVDNNPEFDPDVCVDIMTMDPEGLQPEVVLASPPCVDFSVACITDKWDYDESRRPKHLPKIPEVAHSVALVFRTLWLIHELDPDYWFLENPQGMLNTWLGDSVGRVEYCAYGEGFKKPTHLWGRHPPMDYRSCPGPDCDHKTWDEWGTYRDEDSSERAKVPDELSEEILEAVEDAYENPPPEQGTLFEADGGWNSRSQYTESDRDG